MSSFYLTTAAADAFSRILSSFFQLWINSLFKSNALKQFILDPAETCSPTLLSKLNKYMPCTRTEHWKISIESVVLQRGLDGFIQLQLPASGVRAKAIGPQCCSVWLLTEIDRAYSKALHTGVCVGGAGVGVCGQWRRLQTRARLS